MRLGATIPFLVRGAIAGLLVIFAAGLVFDPVGLRPEAQSADATLHNEVKKLTGSGSGPFDGFGVSVAVSGDIAIVGEPYEGAGAAYVYERNAGGPGNWGEVKMLTASDAQGSDFFGISVAISGDTAVVGARGEDAGGGSAGAAYVFRRDEGGTDNWGEVKKLTASDAEANDWFGFNVAVSGDTAVVGAFQEGATGAAYVFGRDVGGPDNWGEVKKLTASDAEPNDNFGRGVAVSGNTVVVGASLEDAGGNLAGAAYVFLQDAGGADNWGEIKKLTASDAETGDQFGLSVAVSGDTAVVGAFRENFTPDRFNVGAAYVFQRDLGGTENWGEVKKLRASDFHSQAFFGLSVAVAGDIAVVGAHLQSREFSNAGGAYIFVRHQGGVDNWGEDKKLSASDASPEDRLGIGVAASGGVALVGANGALGFDTNPGAAYVFLTKQPDPGDTDGDGCSDQRENGPDETLGGQRDYKDPNDYYDVYGPGQSLVHDGVIDLPNDILGVIQHFSPAGAPPYDVRFDRGPTIGADHWQRAGPDGVIDLPNDILGVTLQFGQNCV